MARYSVILPEATQNIVNNPSLETNTTGYAARTGSTITRTSGQARRGIWSLNVAVNGAAGFQGVDAIVTLAATTEYTASVDVLVTGAPLLILAYNIGAAATVGSAAITASGAWQRVELTFTSTTAGSYYIVVCTPSAIAGNFAIDGLQVEAKDAATTYIDGDHDGGAWVGTRHASQSVRSALDVGGRLTNFDDFGAYLVEDLGTGMAPVENLTTEYAQLAGSRYQRTRILARVFTLIFAIHGTSHADLQAKRSELIQAVTDRPVQIYDNETGRVITAYYEAGLEGGSLGGFTMENVPLRFLATDPYWYDSADESKALAIKETFADADYIVLRGADGVWGPLAGGLNGLVAAAVWGPDRRLYVGGAFDTAYNAAGTGSAVTVNRIAVYDPETGLWSALGSGFNGAVEALAFDAAGTLYAGGSFTDASWEYLAQWDGAAWNNVGGALAGTGPVRALAYSPADGYLYIGGVFGNYGGIAVADNIVRYDGSTLLAVGDGVIAGADDAVFALAVAKNGDIYAGGIFGDIGGSGAQGVARWNGTAWSELADGLGITGLSGVTALTFTGDGTLYAGGSFENTNYPYLARWNGVQWAKVGDGVAGGAVTSLSTPPFGTRYDGQVALGGLFTSAGGLTFQDRIATWTGATFAPAQIDLPGSANVLAIAHHPDGLRVALGFNTSGTATASNIADTTVTNTGNDTGEPTIRITGPGRLESIINTTTGKALYFDLTLAPGEVATLDLRTRFVSFTSTARGNIIGALLDGSDRTDWRLVPGDNTVLVKMSGTTTAASGIGLVWQARSKTRDAN